MDANDEDSTTGSGPDVPDGARRLARRPSSDTGPADGPGAGAGAGAGQSVGRGAVPQQGRLGRAAEKKPFPDVSVTQAAAPDVSAAQAEASDVPVTQTAGPAGRARQAPPTSHSAPPDAGDGPEPPVPAGLAALSPRYQVAAALALALVAVVTGVHLGMVFLHVAPSNTVSKQHGRVIDDWIYPEFEQNWKLFAPNPLQQNIAVQVRALVRAADGTSRETGWYDLSALDGRAIDGNPLPSHTEQNELRRAWDFYVGTHDAQNRPVGLRGDLSERYLRRIAVLRLGREHAGGPGAAVQSVQFRSRTTNVPPPRWSDEKASGKPVVRELPWWQVPAADRAGRPAEASAR
ncbi:DUF5819 family protein [Streptomyces sp. NPDC007084]|uniref:DUF5819 family protein n=1 Tax=Streptomyces sp. NPDC007084 TaxID=3154313 RepID=UPI0034515190